MELNDAKYNSHFRRMVMEALSCGLHHPIEWVQSYARGIGNSYASYPEIAEFCNLAINELYEAKHMRKANSDKEIEEWIDKYYASKDAF